MISIQKTEAQKELDRAAAAKAPEHMEVLQEELELEKEKKEIVSSLYDDWIYEYNIRDGKVTTISGNSAQYPFSDEKKNQQIYLRLEDLHPEDRVAFAEGCRGKSGGSEPVYVEARVKVDGEYRWIALTTRVLSDRDGTPVSVIGKISDIHEQKVEELRLQEQARRDAMTGLLNRAAFKERAEAILSRTVKESKASLAVLMVDIDQFKFINDTYGHLYGDTVIVSMADALREAFGEEELIGRFGGDEFTVFLSDVNEETLKKQIVCLRESFVRDIAQTEDGHRISCSVGVAMYGKDGTTLEELLKNADCALYFIKENGRNSFAFCTEEIKKRFPEDSRKEGSQTTPIPDESRITEEITEFAMELLEGSKNIKSAVNMLLAKLGKRFRLAVVSIREYNSKDVPVISYIWNDVMKEADVNAKVYIPLEERKQIREAYRKNQFVEVSDVETLPKESGLYRLYKARGIQALFQCPLVNEGSVFGYISYADVKTREWSDTDKQSLSMIARVIGNYLAREHEYRKIERKVELMKSFDEVTGLLKFDKFKEVAKTLLSQGGEAQYALISVDFAHFKYFNEVYGFRSGDELLADFASLVAKHNPRAVAACRDYADNFLVMVTIKNEETLLHNIETYHRTFIANQNEKFLDSKLEFCCGVYVITKPEAGIVSAIDNANIARKVLKEKQQPGILVFEPSMKANRMREIAILHQIEEAIENSEFRLYLQPKFSLATGKLVGAEALARWEKPGGEVTAPQEFIPPLEKSGKIVALDFFMYEVILFQLKKWKAAGYPLIPVSVNLSRHHIKDENLVDKLVDLLEAYEIESSLVEIEITESAFIEDQEALIQLMKEIKKRGFRVSIDDFGTGYSSLSMLTEVPADIVKLDKEFLKNSASDIAKGMLRNVIRLIKDNQMAVVCEGVEIKEQAEFLNKAGCDIGQGFFFSRPIPVAEFEKMYLQRL